MSITSGLGVVIPSNELSTSSFNGGERNSKAEVTEFGLVASYNWTNETKYPTIIVPGGPNVWTPKRLPMRVQQDSGKVFVDQNKARYPESPLEPLIRSVHLVNPDFDFGSLDLVTDRNNLRKVYRWVTGSSDLGSFRIDAELVGKTVLFTRWESKSEEFITEFRGFGHEFEKGNTTRAPGCEKSTGHHRIVTYKLGGLKLLVRYEVDGCFSLKEDTTVPKPSSKKNDSVASTSSGGGDPDDLVAAFLKSVRISDQPQAFDSTSKLHYIQNGVLVAQSEILELKTRVQHKALDWEDTWPQLYFSQTPTLLLAKHVKGQFVTVEQSQLTSSSLSQYVQNGQGSLARFEKALTVMKSLVAKHDSGNGVSFVYDNGSMKLYKRVDAPTNPKVKPSLVKLFKAATETTK